MTVCFQRAVRGRQRKNIAGQRANCKAFSGGSAQKSDSFKVAGVPDGVRLCGFQNDGYHSTTTAPSTFRWPPMRGSHRFTVSRASGAADKVTVMEE
jgi:hypothetical protein